jgi:hypothetical protein
MTRLSFSVGLAALLAIATAEAAELPDTIKQAGVLRLTVNSTYAPMEYRDPTTNQLVGLDIDLANELAKRPGVKIIWSETPFAELIPSLQTKRADFIISGISDRSSRREVADFIDYLATGPQFFVLAENEGKSPADLCGKKVGTTRSTSFPAAGPRDDCDWRHRGSHRRRPDASPSTADPRRGLIALGNRANIDQVIVDGRVLIDAGRYIHGDETTIVSAASAAIGKIWDLPEAQAAFNG